jgi:hypothetical protein
LRCVAARGAACAARAVSSLISAGSGPGRDRLPARPGAWYVPEIPVCRGEPAGLARKFPALRKFTGTIDPVDFHVAVDFRLNFRLCGRFGHAAAGPAGHAMSGLCDSLCGDHNRRQSTGSPLTLPSEIPIFPEIAVTRDAAVTLRSRNALVLQRRAHRAELHLGLRQFGCRVRACDDAAAREKPRLRAV